ncbi:hypothetical protein ACFWBF_11915 [Streptomyces sp. NPDC060028]|uniref:hypothetical protein n=1 Tax=Streptomyces sp. NPDC060028 TaxID=3347041 RepID=UPI003685003D
MPNWDEVIPLFLPKTDSVKTRNDVAGPGSPKWIDKHVKVTLRDATAAGAKKGAAENSPPLDVFSYLTYEGSSQGSLVGLRMNWTMFNDSTQPYNLYRTGVYAHLEELNKTQKNENVNAATFDGAARALRGVADLLEKSLDPKTGLLGWIAELGETGDNWRGSAAGEFKKYLATIALGLTHIQTDLRHPYQFAEQLGLAGAMLRQAHFEMMEVEAKWFATPDSGATQVLKKSLTEHLVDLKRAKDGTVTAAGLNIDQDPFWEKVERTAKDYWLAGLSAEVLTLTDRGPTRYSMDLLAHSVYETLDAKYTELAGALGRGVTQPNLGLPQASGAGGPVPGPGGGIGDGGTGGGDEKGGGGDQKIPPPGGDLKLGGGGDSKGGGKGGGDKKGGIKPPVPLPGPPIPHPGTGLPGSGTADLLDKNGKPVLGKDHKPIAVPVGSVIGKDGKIRDSKGNLVLGKDGKPLVAPPGAKLKEHPATNPNGGIDPSLLDRIKVPEGAKVNPDGVLVDAQGKPLLDSNGNPYVLPKGASVNHDGILVDAKGRPIDRSSQLLTDTEHALLDSRGGLKPPTSSQSSLLSGGRDPLGLSGSGALSGLGASSGGGTAGKGAGSAGPLLASPSMVSDRALQAANAAAPPGTEADRAKATAAEDAARQLATQQQTQSGPMMPPMGGAGAGAGAGGAAGQKDRQRTTWLSEDEDTWGTDTGTVSGVIGR